VSFSGHNAGQGGSNQHFQVEVEDRPTVIRDEDGKLRIPEDQRYGIDGENLQVCGDHQNASLSAFVS
jgi:hypothetical protein